ncbi:hypothetical protein [Halobacterium wangiae]|uniref:hypothetical protein n=1 Tax=Halobacterium wangiae TaxID=2902623 RepID=UPI001E34479F|nr:hypothetical protein [Halobacterium wangiae]
MSETVEFGTKQTADEWRREHEEYVCPIDDDRRLKTVAFVNDAPDWLLDRAHVEAASGRSERDQDSGQIELTDSEKERVGPFTDENNYRKAAAVRA